MPLSALFIFAMSNVEFAPFSIISVLTLERIKNIFMTPPLYEDLLLFSRVRMDRGGGRLIKVFLLHWATQEIMFF